MKISDLAIEHAYYCNDENYFSNEYFLEFHNWEDFIWDNKNESIDLNLVFRWDLKQIEEDQTGSPINSYTLCLYYMSQRKGLFRVVHIRNIEESNIAEIKEFLSIRWQYLKGLWEPICSLPPEPPRTK